MISFNETLSSIGNVQPNNSDTDSGSSENTGMLKIMFASRNSDYSIFVANVAKISTYTL